MTQLHELGMRGLDKRQRHQPTQTHKSLVHLGTHYSPVAPDVKRTQPLTQAAVLSGLFRVSRRRALVRRARSLPFAGMAYTSPLFLSN
jgi:hypothetical protein